ncbi:MAG: glycosyltransferase family 4 protein [Gemmatimonadota bacterium]
MLKWMKNAGYSVVLVIADEFKNREAMRELRRITFAVHWTKPAYWRPTPFRTRLGKRFPGLRALLWDSAKPFLRKLRTTVPRSLTATATQSRGEEIHEYFISDKLTRTVAKLARRYRPTAVIAEYMFATPLFAVFPSETLKIVDTIDVFSLKEHQVLSFGITDFLASSEEDERRYLMKADVIVAIQSREAELLRGLVPERRVILAGVDFDVVGDEFNAGSIPDRITVVASDNPLNVHGLSGFLAECWPAIKQARPTATLHIVGLVGKMCRVEDPSIIYSGWVSDLDAVYREASVVLNPAMAGTGLKIKSVEALAHGKPLVAWSNGVDGLKYDGQAPFIECSSWTAYRDAIVRLLASEPERTALSKRALAYARREFDADSVYADLRKCLGSAKHVNVEREAIGQRELTSRA